MKGLRGRGEAPGDVVETSGRRETAKSHVSRYLGGIRRAAAMGIQQVWQGQGRGRGGEY